ncbi:hypothetical protein Pcinc_010889 [Petrolisthes cinctipes]|uniref:Uncharacterized protein n=1 Tax=Petrolisthes cinctipes TaxID=88211 RepID=A0AAE1G1X5_PETCI|nr:hypothetical protein Pcinc_010889 [Petrolisthes cinctipes]
MDQDLKDSRAVAKRKFTRKVNLLREAHSQNDPMAVLQDIYSDDILVQFKVMEEINEKLVKSLNSSDENYDKMIDELEIYITDFERVKNDAHAMISKPVSDLPKLRMQRLTPPHFNGSIRKYPTFCKDYERIMKPVYEDDPYVLRSCLSGEALEIVQGADDSFKDMMKRLDDRYGNPSKLVEAVLSDIKDLKLVPEGSSKGFIEMVDIVERAYLDLKKLKLCAEMNTVTMVSHIEKLLPAVQKREWVNILQAITNKDKLFSELLQYLLKEKQALEYMNSDVRVTDNASKARVHATSFDSEPESLTTAVTKLQGKQEKIEECMINLTKQMSTLAENIQRTETGVKNSSECWYHGTNAHDITKCSGFQRLANNDKMDAVRQMGACFRCLRLRHVGRQCTRSVSCSECGRNHHWMIHSCLSKPEAHASSNVLSWSKALLMISSVYSNAYPITTLWDPGSDMNLITNRMAKHLGLKGRSISLEVTRVGNVCSKFETLEYNVPLNDCHGNIHNVKACGISEITSEARPVDTTSVAALWGIQDKDIARPHEPKESVTKRLQAFFDVESLGIHCNPKCGNCKCGKCPLGSNKYSVKEERKLALITKGLSHDPEKNRWIAIYPWIKSPETLPNNLSVSLARLRSTEKRLSKRGAKYAKAYSDQMQDMVARGVARKLTDEEMRNYEGPVHYIPHHEVLRPESKSTPIRIVFNSSASYMGHVLNDYYAKGPDVLNDLFGILLRFREKPVAIVGDISKMYNSVLISELDQMTHRFLWRNMNPDKKSRPLLPSNSHLRG